MARIVGFTIFGLAGRNEPFKQELDELTNVFFGLNGSGKTSLLRILQSALSGETTSLESVPFQQAEVTLYSEDYEQVFTRTLDRSKKVKRGEVTHELPEWVFTETGPVRVRRHLMQWDTSPTPPGEFRGSWQSAYLPTSRLYIPAVGGARMEHYARISAEERIVSEQQLDRSFADSLQRLWSEYSARTLSLVRQAQESGLANILQVVLTPPSQRKRQPKELDSQLAYERVAAFLVRQGSKKVQLTPESFAELYAENPQVRSIVSDIDKVEVRIARAMAPRNTLQDLISRMFTGNKRVEFLDTGIQVLADTGTPIGLESLSSGEKHVLRMFVEVLRIGPNSILIDEPEISLHVDWQKSLIKFIRLLNPRCQMILATHSPEIMADVPDNMIFRL